MTTTQPPCVPCLPDADRFFGTANVPAPPDTAPGRRRYWDDTVTEAIGELRRRLRSSRESVVTHALFAILDLEKHKLRHGRPISGTHVPYLGELDEDTDRSLILQNRAEPPKSLGPILENQATSVTGNVPIPQASTVTAQADTAAVNPTRERGPLALTDRPAAVETPEANGPRSRVRPATAHAAHPNEPPPDTG